MLWNACITLMKELTTFSSLYLGFFMSVLHAFLSSSGYHLNSLLLISLLCLFWDSLLYCLAFCGNQLFELYRNSTDCCHMMRDLSVGESRNRLLTVLYPFFLCLPALYFYIAPLRIFFQYLYLDNIY